MKNNKRRLIKDLPFGNLKAGVVIWHGGRGHGGSYSVSQASTYYETGGNSSNGLISFDKAEESILAAVWDNPEWFADADLKHITVIPRTTSIVLAFDAIDIEDAETLARGIIHVLPKLTEGSYIWNKFADITTQMKRG